MKSLKKILAALMAIMLAFSLAACKEEPKEIPPAGTTEIGMGSLKIGMLYTSTPVEIPEDDAEKAEEIKENAPLDVNYAHRNAIDTMRNYISVSKENIIEANGLSATDAEAFKEKIKELVKAGCQVIIATSNDYLSLIEEVAAEEAYFSIVFMVYAGNSATEAPQIKNTNNNIMLFGADMFEAAYLSGIAAAMKAKEAKKNTIGYVATAEKTNAEVTASVNAFALGAQSVNKKAEVKVSVVKDWTNEEAVDSAVKALEDAKCANVSKFVETDEDAFCATVWHLENAYISILTKISRGEWTPENYFGGITEGVADVKLGEDAAEGTKDAIREAKDEIMANGLTLDAEAGSYVKGVSLLK